MTDVATSASKKTAAELLPCNDPARKDWSWFRDLFIREPPAAETRVAQQVREAEERRIRPLLETPADMAEARNRLRTLLQEAHAKHPYRLVNMAFFGAGKGNCLGKIRAFIQALRTEGSELEGTRFLGVDDQRGATALSVTDPAVRTAINYIISRLWKLNEGDRTIAKKEKYRALGTSTNEPILSWLPEESGVVPYLRSRLDHVLYDYYEQRRSVDHLVSLDAYRDQYKLEIDTSGHFVAAHGVGGSLEADATAVAAEDFVADSPLGERTSLGADDGIKQEQRRLLDEKISELKADPKTRGDWPLRVWELRYASAPHGQTDLKRVRKFAEKMLSFLRPFDVDLDADFDAIIAALNDWDGQTPIAEYLVELSVYADRHRYILTGIDPLPLRKSGPPSAKEAEMIQQADWLAGVTDLVMGRTEALGSVEDDNQSALRHARIAENNVMFSDLLSEDAGNSSADAPPLESDNRTDYAFLCQQTGERQQVGLAPDELYAEMRRIRDIWIGQIDQNCVRGAEQHAFAMASKLKRWEPSREHLGPYIGYALHDIIASELAVRDSAPPAPEAGQRELAFE